MSRLPLSVSFTTAEPLGRKVVWATPLKLSVVVPVSPVHGLVSPGKTETKSLKIWVLVSAPALPDLRRRTRPGGGIGADQRVYPRDRSVRPNHRLRPEGRYGRPRRGPPAAREAGGVLCRSWYRQQHPARAAQGRLRSGLD